MSNITLLPTQRSNRLAADIPDKLRELAVLIEKGEITSFLCAFTQGDNYCFVAPSSQVDNVVLSSLLHRKAIDAMLVGES